MSFELLNQDEANELYNNVGSQLNFFLNDMHNIENGLEFDINGTSLATLQDESTTPYEDVKDFAISQNNAMMPLNPLNGVLSNEQYMGPFGFEVNPIPNDLKNKDPWVYSSSLNKVFMNISQLFPVDFKIANRPQEQPLFVRVTPQYSSQNFAQDPVSRCLQHDYQGDLSNKDIPEHVRQHVIRCRNNKAHYIGNPKNGQKLSIVFPLGTPQAGSETVREHFSFVCKSSCPAPGMNRREIEVIFTLENGKGEVVGRKCLKVRICACPKRDKEKEEKEAEKNTPNAPPKGKKRKVESSATPQNRSDSEDLTVYNFQMSFVGKENFLKVLTAAEHVYATKLYKLKGAPQEKQEPLQENLERIQTVIKTLTKH